MDIEGGILGFTKTQRSTSKDENSASYEVHKFENFQEMHEVNFEKN